MLELKAAFKCAHKDRTAVEIENLPLQLSLSRAFKIVVLLKNSQEDVAEIALDVAQSASQKLRQAEDNINKTYTLLLVLQSLSN